MFGRMQNRYTHLPVFVDVGMPHLGDEFHGGRRQGVVVGEFKDAVEDPSFENGVHGPFEHDIPLEVVLVDESGRYSEVV